MTGVSGGFAAGCVVLYALGLPTAALAYLEVRGNSRLIRVAVLLWPAWVVWIFAEEVVGGWIAQRWGAK